MHNVAVTWKVTWRVIQERQHDLEYSSSIAESPGAKLPSEQVQTTKVSLLEWQESKWEQQSEHDPC